MNRITLIQELLENNINMILTGSLAAKYYGYNAHSNSNDIDFIIDKSEHNIKNIHKILSSYDIDFDLDTFMNSYGVRVQIADSNEYIDLFVYSAKSMHINYDSLIKNKNYVIDYIYNLQFNIISKSKLIESIQLNTKNKYENF